MLRLLSLALVALTSVASAQTPTLDGLPLWNGDLRRAPQEVRDAIAVWETAHRPLPPTRDNTLHSVHFWTTDVYTPWLATQRSALRDVETRLTRSDAPETWKLLAAILVGDLEEHFISLVVDRPPPDEIARDPQLVEMFARGAHQAAADMLRESALPAFERCVSLAGVGPWAARCRARAAAIRARIEPRAPAPTAVRGATSMPAACTPAVHRFPREASLPPSAPDAFEVVVDYRGRLERTEAEALVAAVERGLSQRGFSLVPTSEARAARALVDARRWRDGGPACAAGPTLAMLLAPRHPNLLVARLEERCPSIGCQLDVRFERPRRHGADRNEELRSVPQGLFAVVERDAPRSTDWVAAASRLVPRPPLGMGVLIAGAGAESPDFQIAQTTPSDPTFSVAGRLAESARDLRACFAGPGVVALHVRAQLDASGRVTNSEVQTLEATGPEPALAELRACVQRVVAATPFPCPPDGVSTVEANVCFTARPRGNGR